MQHTFFRGAAHLTDQENTPQKLERAVRLHNEGKLDAAEALYREVLRDMPGHQTALHLSGLIAHQRGRHREAVTLIEAALAGGATTAVIHTNCGVAYRALGDLEKATQHITWAIALDPEFPDAHLNYALVLLDQGLPQAAKAHLEIVLELRPNTPAAHLHLGRIYLDEEKYALAAERLREALRLRPGNAQAHYLLARALLPQGDTRGALASLEAALQLQPAHAAAAALAAKVSFELCHEDAALAQLDRVLHQAGAGSGAAPDRAERARLGQIDLWCAANSASY